MKSIFLYPNRDAAGRLPALFVLIAAALLLAAGLSGCSSYERRQLYPPPPEPAAEPPPSEEDTRPPDTEPAEEEAPASAAEEEEEEEDYTPPPGLAVPEPAAESSAEKEELEMAPVAENTIRVLLFEKQPAASVRIMGRTAPVVFTDAGGNRHVVPAGQLSELEYISGSRGVQLTGPAYAQLSQNWQVETEDGSPLAFIHPDAGWRSYKGHLLLETGSHRKLRIINYVHLEAYVGSVVGSEMNFTNPEALKVQAVISRTYALWNSYLNNRDGGQQYDVTDHVMDQVYAGHHLEQPRFEQAARATSGEVLTWSGGLILAAFHSTCGGTTSNNENVWAGRPLPYLRQAEDRASCAASPHYSWNFSLPKARVYDLFGVDEITGLDTDSGGRVSEVIARRGTEEVRIGANAFRLQVNQRYGTFTLRSAYFELSRKNGSYEFTGHGMGHGVGLCQWGALGFAETGWNYEDILRFYYRGAEITRLSSFEGSGFRLARY